MLTTTLKEIKKHKPCKRGWKKLLKGLGCYPYYQLLKEQKEKPINLKFILENNCVQDTFWVIEKTQSKKINMLLGVDIAESVLHIFEERYPDDMRVRNCIYGIRDFCNGRIAKEKLEWLKKKSHDAASASVSVDFAFYAAFTASFASSASTSNAACVAYFANVDQWKTNEEILRKYL